MPTTSLGFPYPSGTSAGDVPFDMQALADAIDVKALVHAKAAAKRIHWGVVTATTDASSQIAITHGAPFTPTVVMALSGSVSSDQIVAVYSIGTTTFNTAWRTAAGANLATGTSRTTMYLCLE